MIKKQSLFLITIYCMIICSALIHVRPTHSLNDTKQAEPVQGLVSVEIDLCGDFPTDFNAHAAGEFCPKKCTGECYESSLKQKIIPACLFDAVELYKPLCHLHQPVYRSRCLENIIALSADGSKVIMSSDQVRILEGRKHNAWNIVASFDKDSTSRVAMSADGNKAVVATCLGKTQILGCMTDGTWTKMHEINWRGEIEGGERPWWIDISADGNRVIGYFDKNLYTLEQESAGTWHQATHEIPYDGYFTKAVMSSDGNRIVVVSDHGSYCLVRLFERISKGSWAEVYQQRYEVLLSSSIYIDIAINANGNRIVISQKNYGANRNSLCVVEYQSKGQWVMQEIRHHFDCDIVAMSSDGNRIITGYSDFSNSGTTLRVLERDKNGAWIETAHMRLHEGCFVKIALSYDGSKAVICFSSGDTCMVEQGADGTWLRVCSRLGHTNCVQDAVMSANGNRVVMGLCDGLSGEKNTTFVLERVMRTG